MDPRFHLPNEVWSVIFGYLPPLEVLNTCRRVSANWNQIAVSVCRQNQIKLKDDYATKGHQFQLKPAAVFRSGMKYPWSAVHLNLNEEGKYWAFPIAKEFGSTIQSLRIELSRSKFKSLIHDLLRMPNLEDLQLEIVSPSSSPNVPAESPFVFPLKGNVKLMNLKAVKTAYAKNSCYPELLEFILLKTECSLRSLDLRLQHVPLEDMVRILKLLQSVQVPGLFLHLYYDLESREQWANLNAFCAGFPITKLKLTMDMEDDDPAPADDHFLPLENFLGNCKGLLDLELNYEDQGFEILNSKRFQFATMPTLKRLQISFGWDSSQDKWKAPPGHSYFHHHPLRAIQFPSLEVVFLKSADDSIVDLDANIGDIFDSESGISFHTVTSLQLENYSGPGRISEIFPRVKELDVFLEDPDQLSHLFDGMAYLTELKLTLHSEHQRILVDTIPFLKKLKHLDKLWVRFYDDAYEYEDNYDAGLVVLILLQPLHLKISNAKLSEYCVSLLRVRHRSFEYKL